MNLTNLKKGAVAVHCNNIKSWETLCQALKLATGQRPEYWEWNANKSHTCLMLLPDEKRLPYIVADKGRFLREGVQVIPSHKAIKGLTMG
jgi:hypothetical protein